MLHAAMICDLKADGIATRHFLEYGDVLFAAKGTKNFAAVYDESSPPAVASTTFFVLRIISPTVLPDYLAWFLNHSDTQQILKLNARGTSIPSIRKLVLEELEIPIPDISKQRLLLQLSALLKEEVRLRTEILQQRKHFIEQQIIQSIND